jgi:hypothetical protein
MIVCLSITIQRDIAFRLQASDRKETLSWCTSGDLRRGRSQVVVLDPAGQVLVSRRIGNAPADFLRLFGELTWAVAPTMLREPIHHLLRAAAGPLVAGS